jgi:hypothetical protein
MSSDLRITDSLHYSALEASSVTSPSIPSGIFSTPSRLETLQRENAKEEFNETAAFFNGIWTRIKELLRYCLSCLFPNERVRVPTGPISAALLDRIIMGKNYIHEQLRPTANEDPSLGESWTPRGLVPELIEDSKVVVFLKYNGMTDYCYMQINGPQALENLKQTANQRLEALIRHPENREAHLTELSVTTNAYFDLMNRGTASGLVSFYSLHSQNKSIDLNPDRTSRPGGSDGGHGHRSKHDVMRDIQEYHLSSPEALADIERFL